MVLVHSAPAFKPQPLLPIPEQPEPNPYNYSVIVNHLFKEFDVDSRCFVQKEFHTYEFNDLQAAYYWCMNHIGQHFNQEADADDDGFAEENGWEYRTFDKVCERMMNDDPEKVMCHAFMYNTRAVGEIFSICWDLDKEDEAWEKKMDACVAEYKANGIPLPPVLQEWEDDSVVPPQPPQPPAAPLMILPISLPSAGDAFDADPELALALLLSTLVQ
jgi:hypothetical protein